MAMILSMALKLCRRVSAGAAGGALRIASDFDLAEAHVLGVIDQQSVGEQAVLEAGQIFHRLGGLNGANGAGHGAEDAGGLTV